MKCTIKNSKVKKNRKRNKSYKASKIQKKHEKITKKDKKYPKEKNTRAELKINTTEKKILFKGQKFESLNESKKIH